MFFQGPVSSVVLLRSEIIRLNAKNTCQKCFEVILLKLFTNVSFILYVLYMLVTSFVLSNSKVRPES